MTRQARPEPTHLFAWDGNPPDMFDRRYCLCGLVKDHRWHELQRHDDEQGRRVLGEINDSEGERQ